MEPASLLLFLILCYHPASAAAAAAALPALGVDIPEPDAKPSDTDALTMFRSGADAHGILAANWSTADACSSHWVGVGCSSSGRVVSLSLPSLDLRGPLDPLAHLDQLRVLDLHSNRLNGTLVALLGMASLPSLKLLYLSHNDLSGPVPDLIGLHPRLLRVDLSDNSLRGVIPGAALANLTNLLTLRLQDNLLFGPVPDLSAALPRLADFNVSNNELSGPVPNGMRARFGVAAFAGNSELCGSAPPLQQCSFIPRDPTPSAPSSSSSSSSSSQSVVPSNPASASGSGSASSSSTSSASPKGEMAESSNAGKEGLGKGAIIGIAVGNSVFALVMLSLLIAYCCCSSSGDSVESLGSKKRRGGRVGLEEGDKVHDIGKGEQETSGVLGRCSDGGDSDGARSKLVFFGMDGDGDQEEDASSDTSGCGRRTRGGSWKQGDGRKRFELEELLRASAEMVGKGSLGTVYRALLEDGHTVAVKRLRDTNPCARKEFHRYMDLIGRLRHPNLVPLRAFYYAKQEKLLIYDYLPNGTLHARLHGKVISILNQKLFLRAFSFQWKSKTN